MALADSGVNCETLKVLAGYQQGWVDALEEVIRVATEALKEKLKEMKDANAKKR